MVVYEKSVVLFEEECFIEIGFYSLFWTNLKNAESTHPGDFWKIDGFNKI